MTRIVVTPVNRPSDTVPDTTEVIAGTLLAGGGPLTGDVVLDVDTTALDERVRDVIGAALVAGSNVTITVNDAGDTITITASSGLDAEAVRDTIGAALVAGAGITVTVDDAGDTITIAGGSAWTALINDALSTTAGLTGTSSGTWGITGGVLRQSNGAANPGRARHSTQYGAGIAIKAVECEVAHISSSGGIRRVGIFLAHDGSDGGDPVLYLDSANGTTWTPKLETDGSSLLWTGSVSSYGGSGYVKLGAKSNGSQISLYVDRVLVGTVSTSMAGTYVGFYTYSAVADFRNLKTWYQDTPVPW